VIVCVDDPLARGLVPDLQRRVITYGFAADAEVRALSRRRDAGRTRFVVARGGRELGEISMGVPGEHMTRNALAAVCVGLEVGVPFEAIRSAIGEFSGIARRMEVRAEVDDVLIVDDYGHHPAEVAATLAAAREWQPGRRLVVIFQPHRYTRTADLAEQFGPALARADRVLVTSIYAAGEAPIEGVHAGLVADAARRSGAQVALAPDWHDAVALLEPDVRAGDIVLTLGAGDVWKAGDLLAARLAASRVDQPAKAAGGDRP
jgi:UDP-N-acetylmuramate--alanine ligase